MDNNYQPTQPMGQTPADQPTQAMPQQAGQPQTQYGQTQQGAQYGQQAPQTAQQPVQQVPAQQAPAQQAQPGWMLQKQYINAPGMSTRSKIVAGLLGIFLGAFGVHNFYLGNTGKAVGQLLLTIFGAILIVGPIISGIWGLVEGIYILGSHPGSHWHQDGDGLQLQD